MLIVETIARIRREHFIKGKTIKEIARDLKVSRNTVRKVLRSGETLTGSMSTVRLPLVGEATDERALALRSTLRKDRRIDAAVIAFKGSLWVRLSAQAYNQFNEYERLADAFRG
jgi:DNA-binding transcriptional regulator LsrR (DeoR family)